MRLVAVCGAGEMPPVKKWKKILLHSCQSGPYYYNIFNHGTLFFTRNEPHFLDRALEVYVDCIVNNKSNDEIWAALEDCRSEAQKNAQPPVPVFDYHVFGP